MTRNPIYDRLRAGNYDGIPELYKILREKSRMLRIIFDDIDDMIQDTLLKVITRLETFDAKKDFINWATAILKNNHIDYQRKRTAAKKHLDFICDRNEDPEEKHRWYNEEDAEESDLALLGLTEIRKDALTIMYGRGRTQKQTANILGIRLGTLKSRCSSGLSESRKKAAA